MAGAENGYKHMPVKWFRVFKGEGILGIKHWRKAWPHWEKGTCLLPCQFAERFSAHCVWELLNPFQWSNGPSRPQCWAKLGYCCRIALGCPSATPPHSHTHLPSGTPWQSGHICLFVLGLAPSVIQFLCPVLVSLKRLAKMALLAFWAEPQTPTTKNLWQAWQAKEKKRESEDERETEGEAAFGNRRKNSWSVRQTEFIESSGPVCVVC